jgi:hypothetical protein
MQLRRLFPFPLLEKRALEKVMHERALVESFDLRGDGHGRS